VIPEPPREGDGSQAPLPRAPLPSGPPGPYAPKRPVGASRSEKYVREKKFPWMIVALICAAPVAFVVYVFLMPAEKRTKFLDAIPEGVGRRAVTATICLAILVVLARLVLPGAKAGVGALTRALAWFKGNRGMKRVLYAPAEGVVGIVWLLAQVIFAVDMVLVIACLVAFLLYVVRILKPEMFTFLPG
jgi:hypothetical protein